MSIASFLDDGLNKGIRYGTDTILRSNKAINPIKTAGKFILGEADTGVRGVLGNMNRGNMGFTDAVKKAYTVGGDLKTPNYKAIAGTYVGASLAGRVASGGGLYRDSTGNTNLPVVPFI